MARVDRAVEIRLTPLGVTFTRSPSVVLGVATMVILAGAVRFGGLLGAAVFLILMCAVWFGIDRIGQSVTRRRGDRLLPELALRLARALRSGQPPERAIELVAAELVGGH